MPLVLSAGPTVEPVALSELKVWLRIDGDEQDTLLASLIVAARIHVEHTFGLALINQRWSLFLDAWPETRELRLSPSPVRRVTALRVYDAGDAPETLDPAQYLLETTPLAPCIRRRGDAAWPQPLREMNGVEIEFEAGFGAEPASVPEPVRQALLLLAGWWFEDRGPELADNRVVTPPAVLGLLGPYREFRI
jgi:uncharacterized phiE125 gp8 family phage protein